MPSKKCPGNRIEDECAQVLDAYFAHARGNTPSAVVLRVYGGFLPEYEIVIDPENSPGTLVRYAAAKSILGNVYSLGKPHLTVDQYVTEAVEVPSSKTEFNVPDERIKDLLSKAGAIDTSICEHQPIKDLKGHDVLVLDAPSFEILEKQGRVRARVTDTDAKVVSQNPALKDWGLDLQEAFGSRRPSR